MIDFEITESGDIKLIESPNISNGVKLNFYVTESSACCISFYIDALENKQKGICLSFDIDDKQKDTYVNTVVEGLTAKVQNANMRLKTSKGDIVSHKEFGSLIETVKHKNLFDPLVIAEIETKAREALLPLFPNARIVAEPQVQQGYKYEQLALIKIYDNDLLIEEYEMR